MGPPHLADIPPTAQRFRPKSTFSETNSSGCRSDQAATSGVSRHSMDSCLAISCKPWLDLPPMDHRENLARRFYIPFPAGGIKTDLGDLLVIPRLAFTPPTPVESPSRIIPASIDLTDYLPSIDSPPTIPLLGCCLLYNQLRNSLFDAEAGQQVTSSCHLYLIPTPPKIGLIDLEALADLRMRH